MQGALISACDNNKPELRGAADLQYAVTLANGRIKDIFGNMLSLRYMCKRSRSSYILCKILFRLMTKNGEFLPLLELLNEDRENGKELRIFHLVSEGLRATSTALVLCLKKQPNFTSTALQSSQPSTLPASMDSVSICFKSCLICSTRITIR